MRGRGCPVVWGRPLRSRAVAGVSRRVRVGPVLDLASRAPSVSLSLLLALDLASRSLWEQGVGV
jgi:hypothetical protein